MTTTTMSATRRAPRVFGLTALTWCIVIGALAPLSWMVVTAFTAGQGGVSLRNFTDVAVGGNFLLTYVNSLVIVALTTIFTLAFGVTSGYTLARTASRGARLMGLWIVFVRMAPPMGFALPFFLMMSRLRLLDTYPALVLVYLTITLPFATWLMAGYFRGIPVELEEAARIDGCTRIGALFHVVLPAARPGIATAAIFSFISSWNEFFYPLVIAGRTTKPASVAIQGYVSSAGVDFGHLCAAAVLVLIPVFLFTAFTQKGLVRGLTHGSVK